MHLTTSHPMITADEVAAMMRISKNHVYNLARRTNDPLPGIRVGRAWRFEPAAVRAWTKRQGRY